MTNPCTFDALQAIFHQRIEHLPDPRKGQNPQYSIQDAAFGACGIFFPQSSSFLDSQRTLQHNQGQNNAHTL